MIFGLLAAVLIAQATPVPASGAAPVASPAAATAADAAVATRAKDWLHQIQTGKVDRSQLDAKMNAALTDSTLSQVSAQIAPLGNPTAFTLTQKMVQGTNTIYLYKVTFASTTLNEIFVLDPDGKIAGLLLKPESPSQ
jgi:hypothetical protein